MKTYRRKLLYPIIALAAGACSAAGAYIAFHNLDSRSGILWIVMALAWLIVCFLFSKPYIVLGNDAIAVNHVTSRAVFSLSRIRSLRRTGQGIDFSYKEQGGKKVVSLALAALDKGEQERFISDLKDLL